MVKTISFIQNEIRNRGYDNNRTIQNDSKMSSSSIGFSDTNQNKIKIINYCQKLNSILTKLLTNLEENLLLINHEKIRVLKQMVSSMLNTGLRIEKKFLISPVKKKKNLLRRSQSNSCRYESIPAAYSTTVYEDIKAPLFNQNQNSLSSNSQLHTEFVKDINTRYTFMVPNDLGHIPLTNHQMSLDERLTEMRCFDKYLQNES